MDEHRAQETHSGYAGGGGGDDDVVRRGHVRVVFLHGVYNGAVVFSGFWDHSGVYVSGFGAFGVQDEELLLVA